MDKMEMLGTLRFARPLGRARARGTPTKTLCTLRGSRPGLIANGLGFASGVGALFLLPSLPPLWPVFLLAVPAALAAWRWLLLRPLACALVGFLWAWIQTCQILCEPFPESLVRRDLELTGRIAGLPGKTGDRVRFLFRVEHARAEGRAIGFDGVVRLSWYRDAPALSAGERWRLTARLKRPHGFANPGGFDYERWLFRQSIEATGYVRGAEENLRLDAGPGIYGIDRWCQRLRERIGEVLQGSTGEALARALILGDRSGLGPEQWEVLTRTGTSHLIAISGLHVGMVAAFLFFLFRRAWSYSARLSLMIAAPRASAVTALAGAASYSALAGFAVSTQRALIMLAVVLGAVLSSRTVRPMSGIVLALVGVLVLDPPGGPRLRLLALLRRRGRTARRLRATVGDAGALESLGQGPMGRRPGAITAVAALVRPCPPDRAPGESGCRAPVRFAAVAGGAGGEPARHGVRLGAALGPDREGLGRGIRVAGDGLRVGLGGGDRIPAARLGLGQCLCRCAPAAGATGLPGTWLGSLLLLPLVLIRPSAPSHGTAEFTLLDVGQGLVAVIRTNRHVLVYDTDPRFPSGFNTGSAVLLPYLHHMGVRHIDTLIISHADRDHAGGFAGLNDKISIGRILSGEPREIPAGNVTPCLAGDAWTWGKVDFELLYPATSGHQGNRSSWVLRVSIPDVDTGVLLTGDIDTGVENELVAVQGGRLASTILVAGHHGSDTSTGTAFLEAIAPRFVLYTTGYANRFGLPAAAVRERVAAQGAFQLNTASAGAIGFRLGVTGIEGPWSFRREHGHLWSHRVR